MILYSFSFFSQIFISSLLYSFFLPSLSLFYVSFFINLISIRIHMSLSYSLVRSIYTRRLSSNSFLSFFSRPASFFSTLFFPSIRIFVFLSLSKLAYLTAQVLILILLNNNFESTLLVSRGVALHTLFSLYYDSKPKLSCTFHMNSRLCYLSHI